MRQGKYKQSLVLMGISIGLATLTGCATTAANQRYDSPIPVYVDLGNSAPVAKDTALATTPATPPKTAITH